LSLFPPPHNVKLNKLKLKKRKRK